MTESQTLAAMARALELIEQWDFPEAEALRLGWLAERERPAQPQLLLPWEGNARTD